jgi:8-oxo-dGTP pyrophosphatase MutT (NUDIX family)
VGYGNGGWVRVEYAWLPGPLYLRFAADTEGRWHAREMYLDGEARPIEAADLRRVPLAAIETVVLADDGTNVIASKARFPAPDLSTLASHFATSFGSQAEHWVADSFRAQLPGGESVRAPKAEQPRPAERPQVAPLSAPEHGLTDEFLRHVAAAYVAAVEAGRNPAPELAAQSERPVRTVHRWIYLARKRGLLPPGRLTPAADLRQIIVAAIVTSSEGVLITHRVDGTPPWGFVTGKIESGESPEDAAVREVKEETGLEVRIGDRIGDRVHPATGWTVIYMGAVPTEGTDIFVGDRGELDDVKWASLAEALELLPDMFGPAHEYLARELGG